MIASMGHMLGEEILRVMKYMQRFNSEIRIFSSQATVTCPGRTRTNAGREGFPGTYVDGDPLKIRMSLLTLGDIAFAVLSADAYNLIAQRLKEESLHIILPSWSRTLTAAPTQVIFQLMMPLTGTPSRYSTQALSRDVPKGQ